MCRFDLDALNAATADKAKRKAAQKAQNAAMKALEQVSTLVWLMTTPCSIVEHLLLILRQCHGVSASFNEAWSSRHYAGRPRFLA